MFFLFVLYPFGSIVSVYVCSKKKTQKKTNKKYINPLNKNKQHKKIMIMKVFLVVALIVFVYMQLFVFVLTPYSPSIFSSFCFYYVSVFLSCFVYFEF